MSLEDYDKDTLKLLKGATIVGLRRMSEKEMGDRMWHGDPCEVLVLSNGLEVYPAQDPECNGPGFLVVEEKGKTS